MIRNNVTRENDENNTRSARTQMRQRPELLNNHIDSVLLSFIPTITVLFLYLLINYLIDLFNTTLGTFTYSLIILSLLSLSNTISFITLWSIINLSVYWRSLFLSNIFLIGFMVTNQDAESASICLGYYMMCLSFFHLSEYVFTALFNQSEVSTDSFLLNHSKEYGLAALASWIEFFIELWFFPTLKSNLYTRFIGLAMALFGETFRKLAMFTAGKNFNHYIQERRQKEHILVKTGVYSLIRHPSYFGWFYWSIGTQILLANPICIILYTAVSWKFFKTRITYEEFYLLKFFRKEYADYQKRTPSGIPFVKGYINYGEDTLD